MPGLNSHSCIAVANIIIDNSSEIGLVNSMYKIAKWLHRTDIVHNVVDHLIIMCRVVPIIDTRASILATGHRKYVMHMIANNMYIGATIKDAIATIP
jgi:hypothetical protein